MPDVDGAVPLLGSALPFKPDTRSVREGRNTPRPDIGFMTWFWISAIIVLAGEELNELCERLEHPHRDKPKPHPLGVGRKPAMAR